jgi:hypothetical protein
MNVKDSKIGALDSCIDEFAASIANSALNLFGEQLSGVKLAKKFGKLAMLGLGLRALLPGGVNVPLTEAIHFRRGLSGLKIYDMEL